MRTLTAIADLVVLMPFITTLATAQQAPRDACSYVSGAHASAALNAPVRYAAVASGTCAYRTTKNPVKLSFVTVIETARHGAAPATIFSSWLRQAAGYARPIYGMLHALTIGNSVMALRNGKIVLTSVGSVGESPESLRKTSQRLADSVLQQPEPVPALSS